MPRSLFFFLLSALLAPPLLAGEWSRIPNVLPTTYYAGEPCYDGDTCRFNIPGQTKLSGTNVKVRILGLDAPEIEGQCEKERQAAAQARDVINERLSQASQLEIRWKGVKDVYKRPLVEVWVDGQNLAEYMIANSAAVKRKPKGGWCG